MIKTEAGEKMKKENPNKALPEKADINRDGEFQAWEKARHEAIKAAQAEDGAEMNMGGLMGHGMGVIIGIEKESGNEIPAGSKPEEVADDIPAMLSEGEYVVPADVVRWHGVKTFEELRCEAKMGMGLMAQDGRIAEVDDDYEHGHESPEYEIEEKDKPKVEKAKVEVVHAAEGKSLEEPVTPTGGPYYGYRVVFDPQAKRYVFRPVTPETQEYVTTTDYDPTMSTRYTPEALLGSVYGEDQAVECPEGFYYDEEAGACMPEETPVVPSVVQPDGGGDGPPVDQPPTPYNYQLSTKIAEQLGPLSAEDLADYEGETLAEKALSRATQDRGIGPVQAGLAVLAGPAGVAGLAGKQIYNEVGAKRAMMTRTNELSNWGNITDRTLAGNTVSFQTNPFDPTSSRTYQTADMTYTGPRTYNASFNPNTAAFDITSTSRITGIQERDDGSAWATDYQHTDSKGNDIDPFSDDSDWGSFLDSIDSEFDSLSSVTGASPGNEPSVSVSIETDTGESSSPQSTSGDGGYEGPGSDPSDDGPSDSFGGGGTGDRGSDGWGE